MNSKGLVRVRRQESLRRVITVSRTHHHTHGRVSPQFPAVSHEVKLQREKQFKVAWLNGKRVHQKRLGGRGFCCTLVHSHRSSSPFSLFAQNAAPPWHCFHERGYSQYCTWMVRRIKEEMLGEKEGNGYDIHSLISAAIKSARSRTTVISI